MQNSRAQTVSAELKPLQILHGLAQQARAFNSIDELSYFFVNASYRLVRYEHAFLFLSGHKPTAVSGIVSPIQTAPMMQFLADFHMQYLQHQPSGVIEANSLDIRLQDRWRNLPPNAFWLQSGQNSQCGCLLLRNTPFTDAEQNLLKEWWEIWLYTRYALEFCQHSEREQLLKRVFHKFNDKSRPWYRRRIMFLVGFSFLLFLPVRMTVIAPGQIVALDPLRVTAPIDGVITQVSVKSGEVVAKGDVLFRLDDEEINTRLETARQSLETAQASYRQISQQALQDPRFLNSLAEVRGAIAERKAEKVFLERQLDLKVVTARRHGVVSYDNASSMVGDVVSVGDPIMRIIDPEAKEIEIWLSILDAIPLSEDSTVRLHLNAAPFSPVKGNIRFIAFDVSERPNGSFAYNLRASLSAPTPHRLGLKGTARLSGERTTLFFWLARRPLSALRAFIGF